MEKLARAFSKRISILGATTLLAACAAVSSPSARAGKKIEIKVPSNPTSEGAVFIASVVSRDPISEVTGQFQGRVIDFYPDESDKDDSKSHSEIHKYSAVIGIEYGTAPGNVDLGVKAKVGGESLDEHASVAVKAGVFPSEKLSVPPKTVFPSKKEQKIIAKDRIALEHAYATKTASRFWDPPGVMPVESDVTSVFGTSRVYNGKKSNVHLGTDLRAPTGTPIVAPFTGQVVIARKLFYTGFTVILDHGYGLFTIYGHMSQLKTKEGDMLKKGEVMGLAGATGRASGPHLHWGVNLHGTKVDPRFLMQALNSAEGVRQGGAAHAAR